RTLGMREFPQEEAVRILKALEFGVQVKDQSIIQATVPPHRLDIQDGPADLIEEIARIYGYDRLPATLLADRLPRQVTNEALVFEDKLRDLLVGSGLQEVVCYSLTTPEREAPLLGDGAEYVRLKNPISNERSVMRRSVLASVLEVAGNNLRNVADLRLFEIGSTYVPKSGATLPDEPRQLALVMTGSRRQPFWNDS